MIVSLVIVAGQSNVTVHSPAVVQHLVSGVVEAFLDRPQESFRLEIFGVKIVHDPSQVRHQRVEILFGL